MMLALMELYMLFLIMLLLDTISIDTLFIIRLEKMMNVINSCVYENEKIQLLVCKYLLIYDAKTNLNN